MEKIIYLTGASGQIGKNIREKISLAELHTVVCNRNELQLYKNEEYLQYSLGDEIIPKKGNYEHYIFHFAHDFTDKRNDEENINIIGLKKIISSFKNIKKKKIIFISTPDVENEKKTVYTTQKCLSESILNKENDLIIRSSLIFSNYGINKLFRFLNRIPVPAPNNNSKIAPILINNFSDKLIEVTFSKGSNGLHIFIGKNLMTLKEYLLRYHKLRTFFLPNYMWLLFANILRKINLSKCFYLSERILGFIYLRDIEELTERNIKKIIL